MPEIKQQAMSNDVTSSANCSEDKSQPSGPKTAWNMCSISKRWYLIRLSSLLSWTDVMVLKAPVRERHLDSLVSTRMFTGLFLQAPTIAVSLYEPGAQRSPKTIHKCNAATSALDLKAWSYNHLLQLRYDVTVGGRMDKSKGFTSNFSRSVLCQTFCRPMIGKVSLWWSKLSFQS